MICFKGQGRQNIEPKTSNLKFLSCLHWMIGVLQTSSKQNLNKERISTHQQAGNEESLLRGRKRQGHRIGDVPAFTFEFSAGSPQSLHLFQHCQENEGTRRTSNVAAYSGLFFLKIIFLIRIFPGSLCRGRTMPHFAYRDAFLLPNILNATVGAYRMKRAFLFF